MKHSHFTKFSIESPPEDNSGIGSSSIVSSAHYITLLQCGCKAMNWKWDTFVRHDMKHRPKVQSWESNFVSRLLTFVCGVSIPWFGAELPHSQLCCDCERVKECQISEAFLCFYALPSFVYAFTHLVQRHFLITRTIPPHSSILN